MKGYNNWDILSCLNICYIVEGLILYLVQMAESVLMIDSYKEVDKGLT